MSPNYTNTELLTQYLDGELDGDALRALEVRIREDAGLQHELDSLRASIGAVKSYGLYQKVSAIHSNMMEELGHEELPLKKSASRFVKNTLKIAATIFIILGALFVYQYATLSSQSLFQNNFHSFPLQENRGSSTASSLEEPYKKANYAAVTTAFQQIQNKTLRDYFIAGNAWLQQNKPGEAVKCFLSVGEINKAQQSHVYEDDTEYFLAMSYLQNNEPGMAIPIFEKIHADKNHLYNSKVSGWFLQRLHWLRAKS